ncbi:hypothetical protein [Photobacterium jeanii]|nr:hypothetical protein [Photobacterium jeanii]
MTGIRLSSLNSGYHSSSDSWQQFLSCWLKKQDELSSDFNFIKLNNVPDEDKIPANHIEQWKYVAVAIPKSLSDFYRAYFSLGGEFLSISDKEEVGIYSPDEVLHLRDFDPELLASYQLFPIESEDEQYYRYGIAQDGSDGRYSYVKEAIVLGKYGYSSYELILMYPSSRTEDGEVEVAILSHAYEYRTPSFAEMMRQLSMLFLSDPELLPPYSQQVLKGTCADIIKPKDAWWE